MAYFQGNALRFKFIMGLYLFAIFIAISGNPESRHTSFPVISCIKTLICIKIYHRLAFKFSSVYTVNAVGTT